VTRHLSLARSGEVGVYALMTVIGVVATVMGRGYGLTVEGGRVGPGMVPTVAGATVAVLGLVLLLQAGRRAAAEALDAVPVADPVREADDEETDLFGRTEKQRVRQLWIVFALLLATLFAVTWLGFLVGFGVFILVVSTVVEKRRPVPSALVALAACVFVYLVFELFLRVPLPRGLLFGA
jgi:putative tricarboxylic transport membrane protein